MAEGVRATATRARREAILRAALEVFLAAGLEGASIEEIRRRSGASIGSIYHHFSSKEGIAAVLYVEALRDYQEGALAALEAARSAHQGVKTLVRHHLAWVASHPDQARYLLMGRDPRVVLASERPLRELNRAFFERVMDWVRPRVRRGELRAVSPEIVLAALWIGPSQELSRHWLAGLLDEPLETAAPALAEAAWNALKKEDRR